MRAVLVVSIAVLACSAGSACGGSLPQPPHSPHVSAELVEVPSRPPPPRAENVPDQPDPRAVWIDGEWSWTGRRWSWQRGAWTIPPAGATFSPWIVVVSAEARVFIAPGVWKNGAGVLLEAPTPIQVAGEGRRK